MREAWKKQRGELQGKPMRCEEEKTRYERERN